jgi:hypothetical protein
VEALKIREPGVPGREPLVAGWHAFPPGFADAAHSIAVRLGQFEA